MFYDIKNLSCRFEVLCSSDHNPFYFRIFDGQVYLIETECRIRKQPELLLEVSDQAARDREKLHERLDRKR